MMLSLQNHDCGLYLLRNGYRHELGILVRRRGVVDPQGRMNLWHAKGRAHFVSHETSMRESGRTTGWSTVLPSVMLAHCGVHWIR
jgi:hypothetical protein